MSSQATSDKDEYRSFAEFYPFYLSQHADRNCKILHVIGTSIVIALLLFSVVTTKWIWLLAVPVAGYGFAWVGHFFFEHNKPATFKYPFYSLLGDFVMFKDILTGKVRL